MVRSRVTWDAGHATAAVACLRVGSTRHTIVGASTSGAAAGSSLSSARVLRQGVLVQVSASATRTWRTASGVTFDCCSSRCWPSFHGITTWTSTSLLTRSSPCFNGVSDRLRDMLLEVLSKGPVPDRPPPATGFLEEAGGVGGALTSSYTADVLVFGGMPLVTACAVTGIAVSKSIDAVSWLISAVRTRTRQRHDPSKAAHDKDA
eukprot:TRINITY_DN9812_c0_g1_i1.p1 TRINITY_DN9812_c0_g1~~TRINITY_DN9812_c0_g1_i1.p1  ORF type:complete len:205 (-),score=5.78 TRINITY_DN9812_c0_g1_i1:250-864(-)